jgi:rare lipoprotein A
MAGLNSDALRTAASARRCGALAWTLAIALPLALAGCTSSRPAEPSMPSGAGGSYKVGKPYQIAGVWYYPREDENYDATGIGSWYGPQFHGKRTANGETFDQEALTAAHPTLPMPVLVRVTNLENGRSLVVRVNDRGPFVNGREIDLSRRAAELLGYDRKGTAKVRVQYVGRAPLLGIPGDTATRLAGQETFIAPKPVMDETERKIEAAPRKDVVMAATLAAPPGVKSAPVAAVSPAPAAPRPQPVAASPAAAPSPAPLVQQVAVAQGTNLFVQAGSFRSLANAQSVQHQLASMGVGHVQITQTTIDGAPFYRVRVGPLPDVASADASLQSVIQKGHAGARIIVD